MTVKSFKPEIDNQTKILILGTMPGEASLAACEYYAHPRNAFWKIMADVLNHGQPFKNYAEKLNCLKAHHIGLWDNLKYCERKGSLDSDIKEECPNDIAKIIEKYPSIELILLNGKKSEAFFKKYQSALLSKVNVRTMPSTSPANARLSYDKKCEIWKDSLLDTREAWDVYNCKVQKTGKVIKRDFDPLMPEEYHLVVDLWIVNDKGEFLIAKRSPSKKWFPNLWAESAGGSVVKGETGREGCLREMQEELGIDCLPEELEFCGRFMRHKNAINEMYLLRRNLDAKNLNYQKEEVAEIKWADINTIKAMHKQGLFVPEIVECLFEILGKEKKQAKAI